MRNKRQYSQAVKEGIFDVSEFSMAKMRKVDKNTNMRVQEQHTPILIIKTSDEKKKTKLKDEVKKLLDPVIDPVKKINVSAQGKVILHCNDHASVVKMKEKLRNNTDTDVTIDEPTSVLPRIRIIGVDPEYIDTPTTTTVPPMVPSTESTTAHVDIDMSDAAQDDVLITGVRNDDNQVNPQSRLLAAIRKQNPETIHTESSLNVTSVRQRYDQRYDVVISCDFTTFGFIMQRQKLKIGWYLLRVHEQLNVLRCYNCNAYGHTGKQCIEPDNICPICAEKHLIRDCPKTATKCINCVRANQSLGLQLDIKHTAWSHDCPTYLHKMDLKRRRTRYKQ